MARRRPDYDAVFWLQIVVGLYLIALGLSGLVYEDYAAPGGGRGFQEIQRLFEGTDETWLVISAALELVAGAVLIAALFLPGAGRVLFIAGIVILVLWVIRMLQYYVFSDLFEPNFIIWLRRFSRDAVPGVAMWLIARRYR